MKIGIFIALQWKIVLALLLLLGVFFRFYNLEKKVFWADETRSALRISGYSLPETHAEMYKRKIWSPRELQKFQRVNDGRGLLETLSSLAHDDPKHPPLFYGTLRIWAGVFGDSIASLRALAAVFSLLAFPALWFLCRELFFDDSNRERISFVALVLLALSPFHVLYAQEAREYSLWTALIIFSSAWLLRALRLDNRQSWLMYGASLALAFYAHTLTLNLFLAHAIFVLWQHRKAWRKFAFASVFAAFLFAPWAIFIWQRRGELNDNTIWLAMPSSHFFVMKAWLFNLTSLFFDVDNPQNWAGKWSVWVSLFSRLMRLFIFVVAAASLLALFRKMPKRAAVFLALLVFIPFVFSAAPDIILSGVRSTIGRFMIPCLLGIQIVVAYFFAQKLTIHKTRLPSALALGVLLMGGIISCAQSSGAQIWWHKAASFHTPRAAQTINAAPRPLLVCAPDRNLQTLNSLLEPNVKIYIAGKNQLNDFEPQTFATDKTIGAIFLYNPTPSLLKKLRAQNYVLRKADADEPLWRIEKSAPDA